MNMRMAKSRSLFRLLRLAQWEGKGRLVCALLCLALAIQPETVTLGDEFTKEDLTTAERRKTEALKEAEGAVQALEDEKQLASKRRDREAVKSLISRIKQEKENLRALTKLPPEHFARMIVLERKQAADREHAQQVEKDQGGRPALGNGAGDRDREQVEVDAEKQKLEAAAEAERWRLSGNCPIKLVYVNFRNTDVDSVRRGARLAGLRIDIPNHLFGEVTFVYCKVENCRDEPVEAYELLIEFINGFDEVIKEQTLQGTLLKPHEQRGTENGWQKIETAVQVRVSLQRVKLANGNVWTRLPTHEHVTMVVKKPEGA